MKENDCKIKGCWCKCETEQEHADWTIKQIFDIVDNDDRENRCDEIHYLIVAYWEMQAGRESEEIK
jgi:hypothetical protein